MAKFEEYIKKEAKRAFKIIGLSHWDERVKITLLMILTMVPLVIALVFGVLGAVFFIMNLVMRRSHEKEIKSLRLEEKDLIERINNIRKT